MGWAGDAEIEFAIAGRVVISPMSATPHEHAIAATN